MIKEAIEAKIQELRTNLDKLYQIEQQVLKSLEDYRAKIMAHRGALDALNSLPKEETKETL